MNTRKLNSPEEIIEAIDNGEKIEINGGQYWRVAFYSPHLDYWHRVLVDGYKVRAAPGAAEVQYVPKRTMSWFWILFWIALFSYVSYASGIQLARKNVKADTAHIRDVCLMTGDTDCINRALKRIEESTP